jgi:hypothetical protein
MVVLLVASCYEKKIIIVPQASGMIQTQQIPVLEEDERIRWARKLTDI